MSLTHAPDVSAGAWLARSGVPDDVLVTQGPAGFEAYATVHFDDAESPAYRPDPELVALVTRLAGQHTRTPQSLWFALWDGWGEIDGVERLLGVDTRHSSFGRFFTKTPGPSAPAAFTADILDAPRLTIGDWRSYLLFTGPADEVGSWGAQPLSPGWPRELPQAGLTWPEDHAWVIASDVDPSWFTVGGSQALVDAVLGHADLRAEPAVHGAQA